MERKETVKVRELQLGDEVSLGDWAYSVATVEGIDSDGNRILFRPYVHRGDWAFGRAKGGREIITYIGHEILTLHPDQTIDRLSTGHKVR